MRPSRADPCLAPGKKRVGHVCRQSPNAGTSAKAGDTITYYLSSGPNEVEVPNVSGYSENNAKSALKSAGFTNVSVVYENSDTVTSGLVVRTDPSAGTKTAANQTITVTVSPPHQLRGSRHHQLQGEGHSRRGHPVLR